ncbi:lipase family protein [bacterium]|jgi:hypothetical protein|nr:lipase family protein [bacterium]
MNMVRFLIFPLIFLGTCLQSFGFDDQSGLLDRPFFDRIMKLQTMNWYTDSTEAEIKRKYPGAWIDKTPKYKIRYFYVADEATKRQFLAFRWTANLMNAWVDINLRRVYDPALDTYVHNGANLAAKEVMGRVAAKLKPGYDLIITGHSMGGSIAVLLAMHLTKAGYPLKQLVTFGQFRITNRAGTMKWRHLPFIRVAAKYDFVTWLSPSWLTGYYHFGNTLKLIGDSEYLFLVPGQGNLVDNTPGSHPSDVMDAWNKIRAVAEDWEEGQEVPELNVSIWGPGHDINNYIRKLAVIAGGFPETGSTKK